MEKQKLALEYEIRQPMETSEHPPVLFMIHGFGSNEQDLFSMSPALPPEFLIISLRAPISLQWGSYAWYEVNFSSTGGKMSNVEQARQSLYLISEFIDKAIKIYASQGVSVWLMGFSQGSILSYALTFNYPEKFNRVIALSGCMLEDIMPDRLRIEAIRQIHFFVSHGIMDDILPVLWGRVAVKRLKALKIPHQYKEYPMAHGVSQDNFRDMKVWMIKNLR